MSGRASAVSARTSSWSAIFLAASLVPGCWRSFEVSLPGSASGGQANSGGSGAGLGSGGALAMGGEGGAFGGDGSGGSSGPGGAPQLGAPVLLDDEERLTQAVAMTIDVLENDSGLGLTLVAVSSDEPDLPTSLLATSLEISDGQIAFQSADDFWGDYAFSYTAQDESGAQATARVVVHVSPRAISLAVIAAGYGGFVILGADGEALGTSLARAGDVNDDGMDDFRVGAPGAAAGAGRGVLVLGRMRPTNFSAGAVTSRVVSLDGPLDSCAGGSLDGLGDINGDGVPDLLLGAPGCSPSAGAAYVVFGAKTLSGSLALSSLPSDLSGTTGYALIGAAGDRAGQRVFGRADLDGDGASDVMVSTAEPPSLAGVLEGVAGELSLVASLTLSVGAQGGALFPVDGSVLGDLNGDGRDEIVVASRSQFAVVSAYGGNPQWASTLEEVATSTEYGVVSPLSESSEQGRVAGVGNFGGTAMPDMVLCGGASTCGLVLGEALSTLSLDSSSNDWAWSIVNLDAADAAPAVAGGVDLGGTENDDLVITDSAGAILVWGRDAVPSVDLDRTNLPAGAALAFVAEVGVPLTSVEVVGDVNGDGFEDLGLSAAGASGGAGRIYIIFGGVLD